MTLTYEALHRLAHEYMKGERPGHTLQTSALVNEAFVKLIDHRGCEASRDFEYEGNLDV